MPTVQAAPERAVRAVLPGAGGGGAEGRLGRWLTAAGAALVLSICLAQVLFYCGYVVGVPLLAMLPFLRVPGRSRRKHGRRGVLVS